MEFGLYPASENSKTKIYSFGGLNRTRKAAKYEFSEMANMSFGEYPCIAPCDGMKQIAQATAKINAVCAPDATNVSEITGITGVYDGGFYYNGVLKSGKFTLSAEWKWEIVQKGNTYIINGYDTTNKKSLLYYYNIDTDEFDEGGTVMRNLIVTAGEDYIEVIMNDSGPVGSYTATKPDGTVIDCSDFFLEYREYSTYDTNGSQTWLYDKNLFDVFFDVGDEVSIEGFPVHGEYNGGQMFEYSLQSSAYIEAITAQPYVGAERNNTVDTDNLTSLDSLSDYDICYAAVSGFSYTSVAGGSIKCRISFDLKNKNGDTVTFKDLASSGYYCCGITIKKKTRVLDNIAIHHGRIWGSAPSGNQIYASSSDDIFSFSSEDITKRYAARIPSDTPGAFTALCSYNNDLVAFKPDSITIISGTNATNYAASVISGVGCISPKSVAVTPEGVVFLSYNGFYLYDGSLPRCISTKLNKKYISANAGFDGISYYTDSVTSSGEKEFLVYNMNYGLWSMQKPIDGTGFFRFLDSFYIVDGLTLYRMDASLPVEWSFTLAKTHENNISNKGINEIWIRADVSEGASFCVETDADGRGFRKHKEFEKYGLNVYRCPVRMRMGENYSIRISGCGKVVIYEIEIRKSDGGRVYKES